MGNKEGNVMKYAWLQRTATSSFRSFGLNTTKSIVL